MAILGWAKLWERQGQDIEDFPHVKRWLDTLLARPAVQRGLAVNAADRGANDMNDPAVRAVLFGQTGALSAPASAQFSQVRGRPCGGRARPL